MQEERVSLQPLAWIVCASKEPVYSIFSRRQAREAVVATMLKEALKEKAMLKGFGILSHVVCRHIYISQGLTDVLPRRQAVCVRPQGLRQALLNLFDRCIGLNRCGMNLRHSVVELLRKLALLHIRHN